MSTIRLFVGSIKATLTNISALIVFAVLYALLLLSAYIFISTREATVWQVLLTYALMILIPVLFFVFQSAIVNSVREHKLRGRVILIDALKFFLISIPVLLLALLAYYLLDKIAIRYPAPAVSSIPFAQGPPPLQPIHWPSLVFATLRFVLLGVLLPLVAIDLWIAIAGGEVRALFERGSKSFFLRFSHALVRSLGSESVLIYALGLIVFFVLPYAFLFLPVTPKGNKTDFTVFILRLLLAYLFSLIGWVMTVSALTKNSTEAAPAMSVAIAEPVEAAA